MIRIFILLEFSLHFRTEILQWFCREFFGVTQLHPTLYDPMTCSTAGFPVFIISLSCSKSCPLSQWGHTIISFSVSPFSSCPQFSPALGSFPLSWLFPSGDQSIGASASVFQWNSGLILFRIDWFDLAVQGTLKSLLQYQSLKASILLHSAVFMVQLSYPYMTTGIALTRWTLVGNVMFLLFILWIIFLPRSKHLIILWLQSLSTVILEPKKIKSVTVSSVSPSICHEVMGPDAMIFVFWMLSFKSVFSTILFHLHQEAV